MTVSIIVATYRREQELTRALDSLCNQTFKDFEVVVVDDNDEPEWNKRVGHIIDFKRSKTDLCIKLVQNHPNQGSAKSRNIGIELASGNYISFLDDDDVYLPEKIEKQLAQMISDGSDFSITDLDLFNENETLFESRKRAFLNGEGENLLLCHLKYHLTGTDTMMFKKAYLIEIGCFGFIDVGDEFYLMMKAIRGGGKFSYLPRSDVKAYVHPADGGLSSGQKKVEGEKKLYEFKKSFFKQISYNDRRCIRMRHYAVLSFVSKKNKKYVMFFYYGLLAVLTSPINALKLIKNH